MSEKKEEKTSAEKLPGKPDDMKVTCKACGKPRWRLKDQKCPCGYGEFEIKPGVTAKF